jgi:predicted permease
MLEMALCLVLVAGAAVFVRSFQNLQSVPVGFSTQRISVIRLSPVDRDGSDPIIPDREAMRLADWLRQQPAIQSVGLTDTVLFNDSYTMVTFAVPGVPREPRPAPHLIRVDQGHFQTLGMHVLAGRPLDTRDTERSPKVAMLSENVARRLFPNQSAIGKRVLLRGVETQVIGVVNDTKSWSVSDPAPEFVYIPWPQGWHDNNGVTFEVRSSLTPQTLGAMIASQIRAEHLPAVVDPATKLDDEILESMHSDRLRMQGSSLFSGLALLLIIVGIYGLMAYSVVRRTREIGIRVAVGSTPNGIVRLMLDESLRLVLAGVIVGIPGAIAVMKAISSMVFGLSPVDPASLAIAALVLAATGIAASAVPAWRAARLDPVSALRVE